MKATTENIRRIFEDGRTIEKELAKEPKRELSRITWEDLQGPFGVLDRHTVSEVAEVAENPVMEEIRAKFRALP